MNNEMRSEPRPAVCLAAGPAQAAKPLLTSIFRAPCSLFIIRSVQRGFTLLEIVISTGIFMLIAIVIAMGVTTINNSWQKIKKQSSMISEYGQIEKFADSVMRNIIPFTWPDENKKERIFFTGNGDELIFAYIHRADELSEGGIRYVKLCRENGALTAYYSKTPLFDLNDSAAEIEKDVISPNLRSLRFTYIDKDNTNDKVAVTNFWDSDNNNFIPAAIQMTLEWENGEKMSWLRRTAGSSFDSALGVRKRTELGSGQMQRL